MGKMEINKAEIEKYQAGKRKFWIYLVSSIALRILMSGFLGKFNGFGIVWELFIGFLLYRGYMWLWYYKTFTAGLYFVFYLVMSAIMIYGWNWVIYVYRPIQIIILILMTVAFPARFFALISKKELKYFAKVNQLARKRKLTISESGEQHEDPDNKEICEIDTEQM